MQNLQEKLLDEIGESRGIISLGKEVVIFLM